MNAAAWIRTLQLQPHPEGGCYRECYRAADSIPRRGLPARYGGPRPFATSIYFLLRNREVSHLHRLKSDEVWHFYAGSPLIVHTFAADGTYAALRLGRDPRRGERPQGVVRAGLWFGAELARSRGYALVGCTVAPGFDFADFELADRKTLIAAWPQHRPLITRLT